MRFILSLTLVLAISGAVQGAILESEAGGITNNTIGTAEAIPSSHFTLPVPATVFNPPGWATATIQGTGGTVVGEESDVDFYSFTTGGGGAIFDIDDVDDQFAFDTVLSLFDDTGTLVGVGLDSSPVDAGSSRTDPVTDFSNDALLGVITLAPGTYYVAVAKLPNLPLAFFGPVFDSLTRPDGADGGFALTGATPGDSSFFESGPDGDLDYTLHISLQNAAGGGVVPEPMSVTVWALLGTITAGAAMQRSRNAQQG
jgi:hypothetical protein